jgi:hypothetical protein
MLDAASYPANKKVGRYASSDFRALVEPANFTVLGGIINFYRKPVKRKQTPINTARILSQRIGTVGDTNYSLILHYYNDTGKEGHAEAIPSEPG